MRDSIEVKSSYGTLLLGEVVNIDVKPEKDVPKTCAAFKSLVVRHTGGATHASTYDLTAGHVCRYTWEIEQPDRGELCGM